MRSAGITSEGGGKALEKWESVKPTQSGIRGSQTLENGIDEKWTEKTKLWFPKGKLGQREGA